MYMDAKQKLKAIQQQKRRLKDRIEEIDNSKPQENAQDGPELLKLLQRKKMLEQQKRQQEMYKQLQKEYNDRKKQVERQKQLEKAKNEKRIIELEAAMKRVVFQGLKQKVKGMNSDQLLMRSILAEQTGTLQSNRKNQSLGTSNFKQKFEEYLLKQSPDNLKPKFNLNDLNQKRLELFERKEELVMRQILLKQFTASDEPIQIDVMSLNRDQLLEQLEKRDINFDEFMHNVKKEDIIQHYGSIKNQTQQNIDLKKQEMARKQAEVEETQRRRIKLKEQISQMPFRDVQIVKRLIYDMIDQLCDDYDKRHADLTQQDKIQRSKKLQQDYEELLNKNLVEELSNQIVDEMLQNIRKQMVKESAEQIQKLNELAHQKTEDCFKTFFGQGDIASKINQLDKYKLNLTFVDQDENQINRPKEERYLKNSDNNQNNVYQTEKSTTNLVNDIVLLQTEDKYFQKIISTLKNQKQFDSEETVFIYDKELYAINRQKIQSIKNLKVHFNLSSPIDGILNVYKMHRNWLLQTQRQFVMLTPWNRQQIGTAIGTRISNPCGNITSTIFYPVTSLLASPTSVLLGFQKGQILKYNFNLNRITSTQTNVTHYLPVVQHAKSGGQPAFPLDNRNFIPIEQAKLKANDQLHQFRQFFQHHSEPIIFLGFYRIDKMISVDKSLKCALWQYGEGRGVASYEPLFKFEIKSSYQIFKEDENPRYKDIYPNSSSSESPQQMYKKYMQTQTFLKMQLYNNPKKQIAYFKSPNWENEDGDKPIWKITYKQSKSQVNKIIESFYNVMDGKITAQQAKLQGGVLYILCERQHVIRHDLKTIKIYSWNIQQKRLGRIGVEIDMYKDQKINSFVIIPNMFKGVDLDIAVVVNSGRILMFSLVSGQLLKNINEEIEGQESKLYFKGVVRAADKEILYSITANSIYELSWEDGNTPNQRNKINKAIDNAKRKYFR